MKNSRVNGWVSIHRMLSRSRRQGHARGQTLVEFSLALTPFLLLLFAIIEFGWGIYSYSQVNNAANEGARRGMVLNRPKETFAVLGNSTGTYTSPTCSNAVAATIVQVVGCQIGILPKTRFTVELVTPDPTKFQSNNDVPPGVPISVTVKYAYAPIILFPMNQAFTMTGFAQTQTQ
jgi:Flp pilus assembly protein TadG